MHQFQPHSNEFKLTFKVFTVSSINHFLNFFYFNFWSYLLSSVILFFSNLRNYVTFLNIEFKWFKESNLVFHLLLLFFAWHSILIFIQTSNKTHFLQHLSIFHYPISFFFTHHLHLLIILFLFIVLKTDWNQ